MKNSPLLPLILRKMLEKQMFKKEVLLNRVLRLNTELCTPKGPDITLDKVGNAINVTH